MFFLPLELFLISSSLPNTASRARAIANSLSVATSFPVWSFITFSTGFNFGGVTNGIGGGITDFGW